MRQIKFRAWDKEDKKMGNSLWTGIEIPSGKIVGLIEGKPVDTDRFIVMQFTGLLDKNGKEIYEGDILKYTYFSNDERIEEVKFGNYSDGECYGDNQHIGYFTLDTKHNYKSKTLIDISNICEIIGNIYENKDLLT